MISKEFESFIDFAIIDGIISEKERDVLHNRARLEGVDLNELELIIEAKLFQKGKGLEKESNEVDKCSICGDIISHFSTRCGSCGADYSKGEIGKSIIELLDRIKELEDNYKKQVNGLMTAFSDSDDRKDLSEQKSDLIKNHIVPNTKQEILSFLSVAIPFARKAKKGSFFSSLLKSESQNDRISNAWKFKCEQLIVQSRFSMKEDQKTLLEINQYAKELEIK